MQFKETVAQLEGTEKKEIPLHVIESLLECMYREGINPLENPDKLTYRLLRSFLRRTKNTVWFRHIVKIRAILTKQPSRKFSEDQKQALYRCFEEIQGPFKKYKGKRKNLLSYQYICYKLCELHQFDEFLPDLYVLKGPKNRLGADEIWKQICEDPDCQYEFIPTPLH